MWLCGFVSRLSDDDGIEEIFRRLSDHIELRILQGARLRAVDWESALETFLDRMSNIGIDWWLYGSAALVMRGIGSAPGDVDLVVDDSQIVGQAMRELLVEPVTQMTGRPFWLRWRSSQLHFRDIQHLLLHDFLP